MQKLNSVTQNSATLLEYRQTEFFPNFVWDLGAGPSNETDQTRILFGTGDQRNGMNKRRNPQDKVKNRNGIYQYQYIQFTQNFDSPIKS